MYRPEIHFSLGNHTDDSVPHLKGVEALARSHYSLDPATKNLYWKEQASGSASFYQRFKSLFASNTFYYSHIAATYPRLPRTTISRIKQDSRGEFGAEELMMTDRLRSDFPNLEMHMEHHKDPLAAKINKDFQDYDTISDRSDQTRSRQDLSAALKIEASLVTSMASIYKSRAPDINGTIIAPIIRAAKRETPTIMVVRIGMQHKEVPEQVQILLADHAITPILTTTIDGGKLVSTPYDKLVRRKIEDPRVKFSDLDLLQSIAGTVLSTRLRNSGITKLESNAQAAAQIEELSEGQLRDLILTIS